MSRPGFESWRCVICGVEALGTAADLAAHRGTVRHHWNSIDALREDINRHRESIAALEKDIDHHAREALRVVEAWKASSLEVKP